MFANIAKQSRLTTLAKVTNSFATSSHCYVHPYLQTSKEMLLYVKLFCMQMHTGLGIHNMVCSWWRHSSSNSGFFQLRDSLWCWIQNTSISYDKCYTHIYTRTYAHTHAHTHTHTHSHLILPLCFKLWYLWYIRKLYC